MTESIDTARVGDTIKLDGFCYKVTRLPIDDGVHYYGYRVEGSYSYSVVTLGSMVEFVGRV